MFWQICIAILIGIAVGIFTGLAPGIHVNLVAALMISISGILLTFTTPFMLAIFIVGVGLTHTFLDAIPSIFLGAPDSDHALSVLPGHRMLLNGHGFEAVKLTVIGSLFSALVCILSIPVILPFLSKIYLMIEPFMGYILIIAVTYIALIEKGFYKKLVSIILLIMSGLLGLIIFDIPTLNQPLLAMLSGLFGTSTLIISLNDKNSIPKQKFDESEPLDKKETSKTIAAALFSGSLTGIFPGLGAAHAAIIGMQVVGQISVRGFLMLIGGINTVNFIFSVATFYTLQKARNGAIVAISKIMESISLLQLSIILLSIVITAGIATILTLRIAKVFAIAVEKVDYQILVMSIIGLITILVCLFDGLIGLFVLVTSTFMGMLPAFFSAKRSILMGCLLIPVIIYLI